MRWLHGLQSAPDPHFYWDDLKSMLEGRQGFDIRQIYEPLIVATGNGPYYCLVTTHELFLGEIWTGDKRILCALSRS